MEKLNKLAAQARARLAADPEADQVVVLETTAGEVLVLENHGVFSGDPAKEAAFLTELGKKQAGWLVCMFQGQFLDVPSQHLRQVLLKANPKNGEAKVLLRGEHGMTARPLQELQ